MGTIDGHLIAIDAKSGKPIWDVALSKPELGYSLTMAPLVVKDKVIMGPAGGEYGIRGFIAAYDAKTGKEVWRFNTVPAPGEPGLETWPASNAWEHGGGSIWVTGSYDPDLNLTYWGVGNPGPDWNGDPRPGDNLYTDSVVALDPDTGKLKWHYQFTPHDEFDYDSTQVPVLADIEWQGRPRKVMLWANRNGFWYVLDRATGEFLQGKPFVRVNWAEGIDEKGRPKRVLNATAGGHARVSEQPGRHELVFAVLQPAHRTLLHPELDGHLLDLHQGAGRIQRGQPVHRTLPDDDGAGAADGTWRDQHAHATRGLGRDSGVRSEDRRVEVAVQDDRRHRQRHPDDRVGSAVRRRTRRILLRARRATGALLWKGNVGGQVSAGPMSYAVGGRQYVAIAAGSALFVYALRQ